MKHQRLDPPAADAYPSVSASDASAAPEIPDLDPVPLRHRHDGWTPHRQVEFIRALAACGCVHDAATLVGMTARSAYRLRARPSARSFREAWDIALDQAVDRLADAVMSRAIDGVARPVFYQGEQVGERRYYDERLAMFILSRRAPERFGRWIDRREARCENDLRGSALSDALDRVGSDAALPDDRSPPHRKSLHLRAFYTEQQVASLPGTMAGVATAEETDRAILKRIAIIKATREREAARGIYPPGAAGPPNADSRDGDSRDEEE